MTPEARRLFANLARGQLREGARSLDCAVAGRRFRLSAPPLLAASLFPALAHRASAGEPELRVHLSCGAGRGPDAVDVETMTRSLISRGDVKGMGSAAVQVFFDSSRYLLCALDQETATGYWWILDPAFIEPRDIASPCKELLAPWLCARGLVFMHGAAVGGEAVDLLVGPGGAGKSTTALTALAAGLTYLGDDYVLVDPARRTVSCLYASGKLRHGARSAALGARLKEQGAEVWEGREVDGGADRVPKTAFVFPPDRFPIAAERPLRRLLLARIGDGPSALLPASRAEAFRALAPSSLFQLPFPRKAAAAACFELAARLPAFTLRLGEDPAQLVALLREGAGR